MHDFMADLRYALRSIRRSPGYAATASLVLALAIAANAVAFAFVNSLFFRPPAVDRPSQLVRIYTTYAEGPRYFTLSYPDFQDIGSLTQVYSGVVADYPAPFSLTANGTSERRWGYLVSGNYFTVLGVHAVVGRLFAGDRDGMDGTPLPIVLGHACWRNRFGGDTGIVGRNVEVNGRPATIVGVAPAAFTGMNVGIRPDFWIPVRAWTTSGRGVDQLAQRGARGYFVVGRLRADVSVEAARAATSVLARRLQVEFPDTNRAITFTVLRESEGAVHPLVRGPFVSFTAAVSAIVGLVLLLACSSVAGLLVARSAARSREIGVRLALGATRGRIVRQLLAESSIVWAIAGVAGIALGAAIVRWLASVQLPTDRPVFVDVSADTRVLLFGVLVTSVTAAVFGLAPALASVRLSPSDALRPAAINLVTRSPLRSMLVIGQVALSVTLLVAAALCLRSLLASGRIDLGFDPRGVAVTSVDPALHGYDWDAGSRFMQTLRDRVASAPGVQSAGLANRIPFEMNIIRTQVEPVGGPGNGLLPSVDFGIVDGGYFAAMRIAVTEGRVFSSADTPDTPRVVVINHTLARRLWPNGSAVGKHVRVDKVKRQVVGVVKDGKYLTLGEEPTPFLYLPFEQGGGAVTVVVRAADPAQALARVRENARAMDPTLPLYNVRTMDEHLEISGAPARVTATLFGAFGALALLLASVGVYGLLAWSVAQRTREIGIRRALGASDGDLVLLITAQALGPVIAGLAVGGGLAFLVSRVLQGILYSVRASDPAAYTSAVAVLLVTAAAASSMPAFRAVRIAPVDALRHE